MGKKAKKNSKKNKGESKLVSRTSLVAKRTIYLNGEVCEDRVGALIEEILELLRDDSESPIFLCLNTRGGNEQAAQDFHTFATRFLRFDKLVTIMLGRVDRVSSILMMSGQERVMDKDGLIDISDCSFNGFAGHNGRNGNSAPNTPNENAAPAHLLEILNQTSSRITAAQALNAGIVTDLL